MKMKIVSLTVFLCGVALFVNAMGKSHKQADRHSVEPRSFVVNYIVSRSEKGGPLTPFEYRVKAVNKDGEYKETRYPFNGKPVTWVGTSDGLYMVSGGIPQFYGERNPEISKNGMRSEEELLKSPQFSRIEQLAGLKTYVLKMEGKDGEMTEISSSPETGMMPLKIVTRSSNEAQTPFHVIEAISVEFRELAGDELKLPDLPIHFDIAEKRAKALRDAGQPQRAEMAEQAISKLKAISNK